MNHYLNTPATNIRPAHCRLFGSTPSRLLENKGVRCTPTLIPQETCPARIPGVVRPFDGAFQRHGLPEGLLGGETDRLEQEYMYFEHIMQAKQKKIAPESKWTVLRLLLPDERDRNKIATRRLKCRENPSGRSEPSPHVQGGLFA